MRKIVAIVFTLVFLAAIPVANAQQFEPQTPPYAVREFWGYNLAAAREYIKTMTTPSGKIFYIDHALAIRGHDYVTKASGHHYFWLKAIGQQAKNPEKLEVLMFWVFNDGMSIGGTDTSTLDGLPPISAKEPVIAQVDTSVKKNLYSRFTFDIDLCFGAYLIVVRNIETGVVSNELIYTVMPDDREVETTPIDH